MKQPPFIHGEKVVLRALTPDDATERYLGWLNDPVILRYRGPKSFPTVAASMERFLADLDRTDRLVLAICDRYSGEHLGNIALTMILWPHGSAELSILLGERSVHGKGLARDAIDCLARHSFDSMGLHRLWAESPNPAFNKVMRALNWSSEGRKREAFLLDGRHVDIECWGLLARERRAGTAGA